MHDYVAPFREVATQLGLTLAAPTEGEGAKWVVVVLDGTFEGSPVHVYRAHSGDARYSYVWVSARRTLPGDVGLSLSRHKAGEDFLGTFFGTPRVPIDPAFDEFFSVRGPDPVRLKQFFDEGARKSLLEWNQAARADASRHKTLAWGIFADDERVHLELQPETFAWKMFDREIAVDELKTALTVVTRMARTMDVAMSHTPAAPQLARHADGWRAFADARGLTFTASPLRITGRVGGTDRATGAELVVRALATSKGMQSMEIRRPLATPLPFFLRIKPRQRLDFYSWDPEGPHEHVGDAELDAALNVVTSDLAAARALVTRPAVRAALLAAHAQGDHVLIDPHGIGVERTSMDPAEIDAAVGRVDAIVRAVG